MKIGEEAVVFCPSKLLPPTELLKLPKADFPLVNLAIELEDFKQVRPRRVEPKRDAAAASRRRWWRARRSWPWRPLPSPPPSQTQIRDLADDGGVIKRIIRKGKGIFPMDSPVEDASIVAHWRCATGPFQEQSAEGGRRRVNRRPTRPLPFSPRFAQDPQRWRRLVAVRFSCRAPRRRPL